MLIAEIARQQLSASESAKIDGVLKGWEADFPGMSDMVGAAVWMDHLKCTAYTYPALCQGGVRPAMFAFDSWHYADLAYNPDHIAGAEAGHEVPALQKRPSSLWALEEAMATLRQSDNRWSLNFMIRVLIHVVGDLHQPLHDAEGFFDDQRFGNLSNGDRGGNLIKISDPEWSNLPNLHVLWDSAAGLYLTEWPLSDDGRDLLAQNASALLKEVGRPNFAHRLLYFGRDEICVRTGTGCAGMFAGWAQEAHELAINVAYSGGISAGGTPSAEYISRARQVCRRQIVVAGQRLAGLLQAVADRLPDAPASDGADLAAVQGHGGAVNGILVAACAGQSVALFVLAALLMRRQRVATVAVDEQGMAGNFVPCP